MTRLDSGGNLPPRQPLIKPQAPPPAQPAQQSLIPTAEQAKLLGGNPSAGPQYAKSAQIDGSLIQHGLDLLKKMMQKNKGNCAPPPPPKCETPPPKPTPAPCPAPAPHPVPPPPPPHPTPAPCPTPAPHPVPPPPPPPPVTPPKVMGSLNISGDPDIRVTTPGVTIPQLVFNEPAGKVTTLLNDPDQNFSLKVEKHFINDQGSKGIKEVNLTVGGKAIQFANDGSLMVDGVSKGKLTDAADIAPIDLGNGVTVGTALVPDGTGTAKRLVFTSGDYQVTAALRQPNQAGAYYDLNVAETRANAADNATGDNLSGNGTLGIDDLLRQEPTTR